MMNKKDRDFKKAFNKLSNGNPNCLTDKAIWIVQRYFEENEIDITTQNAEQLSRWIQFHKDDLNDANKKYDFKYMHKMSYTSYYIALIQENSNSL